jgi:hypothetical protein
LALWKSECLGSDPKLDPKLFTSRIRIRIRNYYFRIRIQISAENGIQIRIRIRKNSYRSTTLESPKPYRTVPFMVSDSVLFPSPLNVNFVITLLWKSPFRISTQLARIFLDPTVFLSSANHDDWYRYRHQANLNLALQRKFLETDTLRFVISSDGHKFVYSLHRYRYRYIVSNDRYKQTPSVICW